MKEDAKTLGILGGMGPHATAYFFQILLQQIPACADEDYPRIIIDCNSRIPDRTQAILGKGPNPVPEMVRSAKILEDAGADLIIMPCITAHHFLNDIRQSISIPFVDLISETGVFLKENDYFRVGILTTTGARKAGIFQSYFSDFELVFPLPEIQEFYVMGAVYGQKGAKSGQFDEAGTFMLKAAEYLVGQDVQAIVMGCTEIPLILKPHHVGQPLIDPMLIGARSALKRMGIQTDDNEALAN